MKYKTCIKHVIKPQLSIKHLSKLTIDCYKHTHPYFVLVYAYLHTGLRQVGAHGEPLSHHHIRVVGLLESLLQRFQLLRGEGRAAPALLAVLRAVASLQDDVLKCAAVGKEKTHGKFILRGMMGLWHLSLFAWLSAARCFQIPNWVSQKHPW